MDKENGKSLEEYIRLKDKIDEIILKKFSEFVAILFTDIVESTQRYDKEGDISGIHTVLLQNDACFPIIKKYNGTVIKEIGDSIMACFSQPSDCLKATIEMQHKLEELNKTLPAQSRFQVRMGIHCGKAIKKDTDYLGDTVNIAARIEGTARGEEIIISADMKNKIESMDNIALVSLGFKHLKGITEPVEIFHVNWKNLSSDDILKNHSEQNKKISVKEFINMHKTKLIFGIVIFIIVVSIPLCLLRSPQNAVRVENFNSGSDYDSFFFTIKNYTKSTLLLEGVRYVITDFSKKQVKRSPVTREINTIAVWNIVIDENEMKNNPEGSDYKESITFYFPSEKRRDNKDGIKPINIESGDAITLGLNLQAVTIFDYFALSQKGDYIIQFDFSNDKGIKIQSHKFYIAKR